MALGDDATRIRHPDVVPLPTPSCPTRSGSAVAVADEHVAVRRRGRWCHVTTSTPLSAPGWTLRKAGDPTRMGLASKSPSRGMMVVGATMVWLAGSRRPPRPARGGAAAERLGPAVYVASEGSKPTFDASASTDGNEPPDEWDFNDDGTFDAAAGYERATSRTRSPTAPRMRTHRGAGHGLRPELDRDDDADGQQRRADTLRERERRGSMLSACTLT